MSAERGIATSHSRSVSSRLSKSADVQAALPGVGVPLFGEVTPLSLGSSRGVRGTLGSVPIGCISSFLWSCAGAQPDASAKAPARSIVSRSATPVGVRLRTGIFVQRILEKALFFVQIFFQAK